MVIAPILEDVNHLFTEGICEHAGIFLNPNLLILKCKVGENFRQFKPWLNHIFPGVTHHGGTADTKTLGDAFKGL